MADSTYIYPADGSSSPKMSSFHKESPPHSLQQQHQNQHQTQAGSNMLFSSHHLSGHHGFGLHHNHHSIKMPKGQNSPTLASVSLAECPYSTPITSLIIDSDGEMHDPSYMSTLRALQCGIGMQTPAMKRSSSAHHSRNSQTGLPGRPTSSGGRRESSHATFYSDDDDVHSNRSSRSQDMTRGNRSSSFASSTRSPLSNGVSSSSESQSQIAITPPQTPTTILAASNTKNGNGEKEKSRRPSWTHRKKESSSSSNPATPRSATLALAQEAERKKENEWGFTGIVDIERRQREAQESLDEERKQQQQHERQQKVDAGESQQHGFSRWASKSMRRKGSNNSSYEGESPSKLHGLGLQPSNSPSFWSMTHNKDARRRQSSSSLQEDRPRLYSTTKGNDHNGLSTILSGREMAGSFDDGSDRWSASSDPTARTFQQIEDDIQRQREDADFILGPSKYRQTKDSVKKTGEEMMDVQTHAHDLRRKMELMALNVRSNAFRAKRKLERGLKG